MRNLIDIIINATYTIDIKTSFSVRWRAHLLWPCCCTTVLMTIPNRSSWIVISRFPILTHHVTSEQKCS
uniref:Uncharacterized protein n=1 Tax=Rhizophora mucronata TaxID=61149 RepID=A0A2P2QTU0_RHIMU